MATFINANLAALNARRNLSTSESEMAISMQRIRWATSRRFSGRPILFPSPFGRGLW